MSANAAFEKFVSNLSNDSKARLTGFIREQKAEIFAARSEEQRSRIAHEFVMEAHDRIQKR